MTSAPLNKINKLKHYRGTLKGVVKPPSCTVLTTINDISVTDNSVYNVTDKITVTFTFSEQINDINLSEFIIKDNLGNTDISKICNASLTKSNSKTIFTLNLTVSTTIFDSRNGDHNYKIIIELKENKYSSLNTNLIGITSITEIINIAIPSPTYDITTEELLPEPRKYRITIIPGLSDSTNINSTRLVFVSSYKVFNEVITNFTNCIVSDISFTENRISFILTHNNFNAPTISYKINKNSLKVTNGLTLPSDDDIKTITFSYEPLICTISATKVNYVNENPTISDITFTFNREVEDFKVDDITFNATKSSTSSLTLTKSSTYTYNLSGLKVVMQEGSYSLTCQVNANKCVNKTTGISNIQSNILTINFTNAKITGVITSSYASISTRSAITFTVTFNRSVTGFTASNNFRFTNHDSATISNFRGSGKIYSIDVMPKKYTSSFTLSCSIIANVCTDATTGASNESISACNVSVNYPAPTCTATCPMFVIQNTTFTYTYSFGESVIINGIPVTSHSVTATIGSAGTSYTIYPFTSAYSALTGMYVANNWINNVYSVTFVDYNPWYRINIFGAWYDYNQRDHSHIQFMDVTGFVVFGYGVNTVNIVTVNGDYRTGIQSWVYDTVIHIQVFHEGAGICGNISCEYIITINNSILGETARLVAKTDHLMACTWGVDQHNKTSLAGLG